MNQPQKLNLIGPLILVTITLVAGLVTLSIRFNKLQDEVREHKQRTEVLVEWLENQRLEITDEE